MVKLLCWYANNPHSLRKGANGFSLSLPRPPQLFLDGKQHLFHGHSIPTTTYIYFCYLTAAIFASKQHLFNCHIILTILSLHLVHLLQNNIFSTFAPFPCIAIRLQLFSFSWSCPTEMCTNFHLKKHHYCTLDWMPYCLLSRICCRYVAAARRCA